MKKLFFTTLVLTALLLATVGTAFAGSALELVSVGNNGGGPTFTFRVNGEFSPDELVSGFVQVEDGDAFPLYCSQTSPTEVVCHASKKIGGHDVVVGFGGARFWADVPDQSIHAACLSVYTWNFVTSPTEPSSWVETNQICSSDGFNDEIFVYDSVWGVDDYFYYSPSEWCGWADQGEGYYYWSCTW